MLRKLLVCLTALFAVGFQPQAKALFLWTQAVGNSVIEGEHTIQVCLLYPANTTYENITAWFDWAVHDCQWWYPDWPYYEQVVEEQYYTPGVPGQDTTLGNIAFFPYSCPSFIATEGSHESTGESTGSQIQRGSTSADGTNATAAATSGNRAVVIHSAAAERPSPLSLSPAT